MWKHLFVACVGLIFFFFFGLQGLFLGFPGGSDGKESDCNAGGTRDMGLIPRWGRTPEEGNGNLFQYSCLENSMDRGAWQATIHGVTKNQARLSD